mgnify:CR=1 FL=1
MSNNLDEINAKVDQLKNIEDLDEKLESIKLLKEKLFKHQQKIYKHKTDIENENNYIIDDKYKDLSFQDLKKLFEESDLDVRSIVLKRMGYKPRTDFKKELIGLLDFCNIHFGNKNGN